MKRILLLLSTIFLLNGCARSLALLGRVPRTESCSIQFKLSNSFRVKKKTGKTHLEHAIAYAEKKILKKKKKPAYPLLKLQI